MAAMEDEALEVEKRASARVGTEVKGKWKIDRLLGLGGMAAVYAATHRNGKRVAVKMLHRELSSAIRGSARASSARGTPRTRSATRASSASPTTT